jgi:hypothetical protein
MENESKYKRRAYQYTLSSIMLNNIKNEYKEVKALTAAKTDVSTQTDGKTSVCVETDGKTSVLTTSLKVEKKEAPIKLKIEETVAAVSNKVSGLMTPKKKGSISEATEAREEKEDEKTEEKIGEKN